MYTPHSEWDGSSSPTRAVPSSGSEQSLFHQAQAGCRESLNTLMEEHDGLVHAVVRRQVLADLPYAEAVQAGRIGLWRAILRYDPDRGFAFSTYAWKCIVHHVWRAVKVYTRAWGTGPPGWHAEWGSTWPSAARADLLACVTTRAVRRALYALVGRLPERLRCVIVGRYGLDGRRACFYRQIGQRLGVSGERARQLHTEALVWLRHPAHSQQVRSLLARHTVADYEWAAAEAQRWLRRRGGHDGRV